MAWTNSFTDASGNTYTSVYWRIVSVQINWPAQTATLVFLAYKDKSSRLANLQPVGVQHYDFTSTPNSDGKTFNTFFSLSALASGTGLSSLQTYILSLAANVGAVIDISVSGD